MNKCSLDAENYARLYSYNEIILKDKLLGNFEEYYKSFPFSQSGILRIIEDTPTRWGYLALIPVLLTFISGVFSESIWKNNFIEIITKAIILNNFSEE